jgi:hypothetical protein
MYGVSGPSLHMTEKSGKRRYKKKCMVNKSKKKEINDPHHHKNPYEDHNRALYFYHP